MISHWFCIQSAYGQGEWEMCHCIHCKNIWNIWGNAAEFHCFGFYVVLTLIWHRFRKMFDFWLILHIFLLSGGHPIVPRGPLVPIWPFLQIWWKIIEFRECNFHDILSRLDLKLLILARFYNGFWKSGVDAILVIFLKMFDFLHFP